MPPINPITQTEMATSVIEDTALSFQIKDRNDQDQNKGLQWQQ
jgi:hypothetical protein